MTASTNYEISFEYSGGDGSNYVHLEGDSTGTHAGNAATYSGSWTAAAAEDLWFKVFTSPSLYGMPGELFRGVTHSIVYDTETGGPFTQNEILSWGSGATAGTAALLALDDDGATGNFYVQLLTGVVPVDNAVITGGSSSATAQVNVTVTARTVTPTFIGQSTGAAIIGAYGVGIQSTDLTASDLLTDLSNTARQPPNNVTFSVGGLVVGEDYVHVTWEDTGTIDFNQRTLNTTLSGAGETAVVVTVAIPSDTPTTGFIRIQLDNGTYRKVAYTAWSGSTFTIGATDFTGANIATAPRNVYIAYLDKLATSTTESFTVVFTASRSLFIRVRDGGSTPIKTFETTGTLGSAGGSTTAIRTADT
ncbi:MAG: hypothetical protein EPN91_02815 [Salinibacterium sp.]|nr:MAG: hypothetical protein EPN91_02815 [Salinibacterium sp.]